VEVSVGVKVGVSLGVGVGVREGVSVWLGQRVRVGVGVGVEVLVFVNVRVLVRVGVGLAASVTEQPLPRRTVNPNELAGTIAGQAGSALEKSKKNIPELLAARLSLESGAPARVQETGEEALFQAASWGALKWKWAIFWVGLMPR
jgi:hypothetical protein